MEQDRDIDSNNNMAEKVINQLGLILKEAKSIENFSIIPSAINSSDRNVSPVRYVEAEHCLGLESWCVKQLFKYSQAQILKLRKSVLRRPCTDDINKLNLYVSVALLINSEVNTFWNIKRELHSYLEHHQEMLFTKLVISFKPKSLQAYTYRTWLIKKQKQSEQSTHLDGEVGVINKAVLAAANNYHAWNHRIWCMENLLSRETQCDAIVNELRYSYDFINRHVSEHSGFHYRQYILGQFKLRFYISVSELTQALNNFRYFDFKHVLSNGEHEKSDNLRDTNFAQRIDVSLNLLVNELLGVCKELHVYFPGHEAIWYHRRFVLFEITLILHNYFGMPKIVTANHTESNKKVELLEKSSLHRNVIEYERNFLTFLRRNNVNNMCDARYMERHCKWLKNCLNFHLEGDSTLNNGEVLFKL